MGEVYRARDPRLAREVAIKVLPASFSQDADRLRRFEQEAKAAGVLNHPNITAVYDIGTAADGAPYVVQELLEGETLRATLAGGRLAQRRTLDYATQVALGLAAAHDKGIVHRDLKPENVFVTKDGRLKILDFGLAKLTQNESEVSSATNLPTETRGTEPGVVLGTLGYMSPEQVRGKPADARSDIFSFGAILYEMLSGKRAFHGDSAADTMSAILREDPPDLSVTNQNISPALERIVRHSLEKNPEQRFQSARDLAFNLEAVSGTSVQTAAPALRRRRLRLMPILLLGLGAFAGAAAAYLGLRGFRGTPQTAGLAGAQFRRLTNLSGAENAPSLSPDGQTVAFVHRSGGKTDILIQRAGGRNPINLTPDCDRDSYTPAFSPDGSLIAYGSQCGDGGLYLMGATGENSRRLTNVGTDPAWSPDGHEIFYSTELVQAPYGRLGTSAIWAIDVASGKTRKLSADLDAIQPDVSPHGLRVAYWGLPAGSGQRDIWTMPVKGLGAGETPVPVTQDEAMDWNPIWGPDGKTLFFLSNRDGSMNLWRVPIDEATGRTLGPAEAQILPAREVGGLALSRDGRRAAYVVRENTFSIDRLVFDASSGKLTGKPEQILGSSQEIADCDVSPDGKLIAFDSRGSARDDLFLVDTDGRNMRQITDDAPKDRHAEVLAGWKAPCFPFRPRRRPLSDLDRGEGRQRPEAADPGKGPHHRASLASGRSRHRHQQRPRKLDPPARRDGRRHPRRAHPAADPGDVLLSTGVVSRREDTRGIRAPSARLHRAVSRDLFARRGSRGSAGSRNRDGHTSPSRGLSRRSLSSVRGPRPASDGPFLGRNPHHHRASAGRGLPERGVRPGGRDLLRRAQKRQR